MFIQVIRVLVAELIRRMLWRRRVEAARIWQETARRQVALHDHTIRRILEFGRSR